jgi:hypothetical protein
MATHVSDFTKQPEEILVDLINADNGTAFSVTQLYFGLPRVLPVGENRNTTLDIFANEGSGYAGAVNVRYNRVSLSVVPGNRSRNFDVGNALSLRDLVARINERYGIRLTQRDYVNVAIPVMQPGERTAITLQAGADSLVYQGNTVLTLVSDIGNAIYLNSVVTDTELDTLNYTAPPTA